MSLNAEEFDDILELAVRRVQTPEGAKKYGQPIGTIITADMIKSLNAKKSGKGTTTSKGKNGKDTSKSEFHGVKSPKHQENVEKGKTYKPLSPSENYGSSANNGVNLKDSSLSGPNTFKVGDSNFTAPAGSKLIRSKKNPNVAYILTPDGEVHAFSQSGEADVPEEMQEILRNKFSNLKKDDANYSVEEFDESNATSLKDQKPGAILKIAGEPALTKIDEENWEHAALGLILTDDELQPQFDAGKFELQSSEATSDTDFSKMTKDEIEGVLDSYETGKTLVFNPGTNPKTITKQENGSWVNTELGSHNVGIASETVAHMAEGTNWLSEETEVPDDAPASLQDPLSVEGKGKTKDQRLIEVAEGSLVHEDDILDNDGISGTVVFHKKKGLIVKREQNYWETEEGVSYTDEEMTASAKLGSLSNLPWNSEQEDSFNEYQEAQYHEELENAEEAPSASSEDETSVPDDAVSVDSVESPAHGDKIWIKGDQDTAELTFNEEDNEWVSADGNYSFSDADLQYDIEDGNVYAKPKNTDSESEIAENTAKEKEIFESFVPDEPEVNPDDEDDEPEFDAASYAKKSVDEIISEYPEVGREVHDEDELFDAPVGAVMRTLDGFGEVAVYIKGDDNLWYMGGNKFSYSFSSSQFQGEIDDDEFAVNFLKPKAEKQEESSKASSPSDDDDPVSGITKADRDSAVAALEAHTGFQVKYGLKSLPDTHPLKDEKNLEDELDAAKSAYPDLPPKQALIAYLKGEKPMEPLADWEKELLNDGETIQIGSEKPKKVVQGVTGGVFTQKEIQDAVDILEAYEGKQFKNALVQKGNPVGALSPNDIIGFEKDKLVGKQKYIDFLKGKLEKNKKLSDAEVDELTSGLDPEFSDSKTPTEGELLDQLGNGEISHKKYKEEMEKYGYGTPKEKKEYSHGDKIKTYEDFKALPVGTQVDDNAGDIYTKEGENAWSTPNIDQFGGPDDQETLGDEAFEGAVKARKLTFHNPKDYKHLDIVETYEDFKDLPVGVQVHDNVDGYYTKVGENAWTSPGNGGEDPDEWDDEDFRKGIQDGIITIHDPEESAALEEEDGNGPLKDGDKIPSKEDFDALEIGTKVYWQSGSSDPDHYTKIADEEWKNDYGDIISNGNFYGSIESGKLYYEGYDSDSKKKTPEKLETGHVFSSYSELDNLRVGQIIEHSVTGKQWELKGDGKFYNEGFGIDSGSFGPSIDAGWMKLSPDVAPSPEPKEVETGIKPGKYNTGKGAKTSLYVKPDGTGVWQGMKGVIKPLSAEEVKTNYDGGMNNFVSEVSPGGYPTPGKAPQVVSAPKVSVEDIPDGNYFVGKPGEAKTIMYSVSGDEVKVKHPVKEWHDMKLSQKATVDFIAEAPDGSIIESKYFSTKVTKTDGKWITDYDHDMTDSYQLAGWYLSKYKIIKIGGGDFTPSKKSALKTKFLKGELLDENGTSVLPDGYSGTLSYYGAPTNVHELLSFKKDIEDSDGSKISTIMNQHSIKGSNNTLIKTHIEEKFGEHTPENQKKWFLEDLESLLSGVDASLPDGDATDLFEFDELGHAKIPEYLAATSVPGYYSITAGEATKMVKEISALFGDGKTIGQLPTSMDKSEKVAWIKAVKEGNFNTAYNLELQGAANSGKSLPKGYAHPGYPDNAETHNVTWQAAVAGEIPAGGTVKGNWSNVHVTEWSMDEVNNYLISAQMQNPTHLSGTEKRNWVFNHKSGMKSSVDGLSLAAQNRKNSGNQPLSEEISWVDNIVPAKTYDILFDGTDYPTDWSGYGNKQKAFDWYTDHVAELPELKKSAEKFLESTYGEHYDMDDANLSLSTKQYGATHAVQEYFENKKAEYEAELLKPVYTKEAGQTKGSHPGAFYTDQFGKKYYMKWWENEDQLSNYRLEIEHAGNKIGRAFGFKTADSKLLKQDGKYGQMQDVVAGVGDLTGFDYSKITPQMVADIEGEHMLDWMLQNDDTKADNAIITHSGNIVGIDKARSFKDYGVVKWDHNAPDGNQSIYTRLYDAVKSGKVSKDTLDQAFLKINSTAARMQKMDNKKFFELIDEGSQNRPSWSISYKIDGKQVSQDVEGLKAAFADQKSKLQEKVTAEWTKLYKDAGLGDLPEPPTKLLGEGALSGFDDPELYENLAKTKVNGTATSVAGSSVIGGSVLTWQDKTAGKDEVNLNGEFFLGPKAQEQLLALLTSSAVDMSGDKSETQYFSSQDDKWDGILKMAKTVNAHATDGQYNASTVSEFEKIKNDIDSDLDQWTPELETNTTSLGGLPAYKFKSGKVVPLQFVDQYKLMLDYYKPKVDEIWKAYQEKDKTENYEQYTALEFDNSHKKYTKGEESLTKMDDGSWIHNTGESVMVIAGKWATTFLENGSWEQEDSVVSDVPESPIKIIKRSKTHERTASLDGDVKETNYKSSHQVSGSDGEEFEITLPTGEVIYFRNAGSTNTKKGQHGKVSFHARGKGGVDDSSAAMQNINAQLESMGISMEAAQLEDAELTYWREMYGILANRNHKDSPKHQKAFEDMEAKRKEIGASELTFLEDLSGHMSVTEQNEFWRAIWAKHFGQNRVDVLISEEGYLPKYDHQNYDNPEIGTGKPYWERLDVDLEEIYATNTIIASTLGKEPTALVRAGGSLGAEERLRQAEDFNAGGTSWSAHSDQSKGSSHNIYTRLINSIGSQNAVFSPRLLLRTRAYSFGSDTFGALDSRKSSSPSDVLAAIKKFKGDNSNETMLPHMATFLDSVEFYIFENAKEREEMIQFLKKKGIEMIRGLPIEDRLVMRNNVKEAIEKIKKLWKL